MDNGIGAARLQGIMDEARALQEKVVEMRRALHQIPEVGMALPETRAYVEGQLDGLGIAWKRCGVVSPEVAARYEALGFSGITESTGIVATIGSGSPCILLRADMDALPIVEENDLPFRSTRPCSHMCGHDAHTAMLLGAAEVLKRHEEELPGTVKLMFQPGEELGYGSQTMIEDGALENPHADAAFGLHIIANEPAGRIGYTTGVTSSSLDTFGVRIQGHGGHTSAPQLCVDPLMVANQIYQAVNLFMTREVAPAANITLSCGTMGGGTAANVLPDSAQLMFGIRSFDVEARSHALERLPQLIADYAHAWRAEASVATFNCPCTYTNPEVLAALLPAIQLVARAGSLEKRGPMAATEDFSYISEAVPSAFCVLGAGGPDRAPHHNPHMVLDEDVFWMGTALHATAAVSWLFGRAAHRSGR